MLGMATIEGKQTILWYWESHWGVVQGRRLAQSYGLDRVAKDMKDVDAWLKSWIF